MIWAMQENLMDEPYERFLTSEEPPMSAYLILDIEVTNQELYAEYVARATSVIESAGGRYLVRGGRVTCLSGEWSPQRLVVIEFKTVEQAQQCLASPEYRTIAPLREQAAISRAIIVEGYAAAH